MAGSPGRPEPTTTLPVLVDCKQVFKAKGGVGTGSSLPPRAESANAQSASGAARQMFEPLEIVMPTPLWEGREKSP